LTRLRDDVTYDVFVGAIGYPKQVVYTYKRLGNITYFIGMYRDCVYDVIGDDTGIYSKLSWRDRRSYKLGRQWSGQLRDTHCTIETFNLGNR